jgi:hypothetical protein
MPVVVVALHKSNPLPKPKNIMSSKARLVRAFVLPGKTMAELTNQQLKDLNDDVQEFIDKLRIHYGDDQLAIAAALTQWGLRLYKTELSTPEFAQLLVYTIETNRYL